MRRTACLLLETLTPLIAIRRSLYRKIIVTLAAVQEVFVMTMRNNSYTGMNNTLLYILIRNKPIVGHFFKPRPTCAGTITTDL